MAKRRARSERKPGKTSLLGLGEAAERQVAAMRRVGRPPLGDERRKLIAIRLDPKVLGWLRKTAAKRRRPYQSLINDILARKMKGAS